MEIVFETNTVVNVRLNGSRDKIHTHEKKKIYSHIVLSKLNILRSPVVGSITAAWVDIGTETDTQRSLFFYTANNGRITLFFRFL